MAVWLLCCVLLVVFAHFQLESKNDTSTVHHRLLGCDANSPARAANSAENIAINRTAATFHGQTMWCQIWRSNQKIWAALGEGPAQEKSQSAGSNVCDTLWALYWSTATDTHSPTGRSASSDSAVNMCRPRDCPTSTCCMQDVQLPKKKKRKAVSYSVPCSPFTNKLVLLFNFTFFVRLEMIQRL